MRGGSGSRSKRESWRRAAPRGVRAAGGTGAGSGACRQAGLSRSASRRNGIGPEHARISALDEAGDGRRRGTGRPAMRVHHADVNGARRQRISGQALPFETRFQHLLHLAPGRGRRGRRDPEIGDDVAHRLAVRARAPAIDPPRRAGSADHSGQDASPLRRVQRAGEQLDDAEQGVRVRGPSPPPRPRARDRSRWAASSRSRLAPGRAARRSSGRARHDPDVAAHGVPLRGHACVVFARAFPRNGTGAKVRNSITCRPPQPAAAQEQQQRAARCGRSAGAARMTGGGGCQGARAESVNERRVLLGPGQDHAHVLEGHASRRFPEQARARCRGPPPPRRAR